METLLFMVVIILLSGLVIYLLYTLINSKNHIYSQMIDYLNDNIKNNLTNKYDTTYKIIEFLINNKILNDSDIEEFLNLNLKKDKTKEIHLALLNTDKIIKDKLVDIRLKNNEEFLNLYETLKVSNKDLASSINCYNRQIKEYNYLIKKNIFVLHKRYKKELEPIKL